jgi:hypothetical protein
MLFSELDLLHLLRSGRARIKQSESQKRREQYTQKATTGGHGVSLSNERHGLVLHLDTSLSLQNLDHDMTARTDAEIWSIAGSESKPVAGLRLIPCRNDRVFAASHNAPVYAVRALAARLAMHLHFVQAR